MDKFSTVGKFDSLGATQNAQSAKQLDKVKNLKSRELNSEKAVDEAAGGFEALLLHQMFKSMWATVGSEGLFGETSNEAKIYRDMLNQAIADITAEGSGIGVKEFLRDELIKTTSASNKSE